MFLRKKAWSWQSLFAESRRKRGIFPVFGKGKFARNSPAAGRRPVMQLWEKSRKTNSYWRCSATPNFFKIRPKGQNLVKPNWNRLRPTKAVKKSQYLLWKIGLASTPKLRLKRIKNPAITCIQSEIIIMLSPAYRQETVWFILSALEIWTKKCTHFLDEFQDTFIGNFIINKIGVLAEINNSLASKDI